MLNVYAVKQVAQFTSVGPFTFTDPTPLPAWGRFTSICPLYTYVGTFTNIWALSPP